MTRLHPQTAMRLRFFTLRRNIPSMSAGVETLLNMVGEPPIEVVTWAGEARNRPRFEALLVQAEEAGDDALAAFARRRISDIEAASKTPESDK